MLLISDSEESNITLTKTIVDPKTNIALEDFPPISLPGVLQSISIGGEILWDTTGTQGSNNQKTTIGYKEKIVTINLILLGEKSRTTLHVLDKVIGENPNTPYKVLEDLERLFKETEESSKQKAEGSTAPPVATEKTDPSSKEAVSIMPSLYIIKNDHINSRGINEVCFTNLNSSENNAKDYITVSLTFEEFDFTTYTETDVEATDKSPV